MAKETLQLPLKELLSTEGNMYELTNAAIHRARQISLAGTDESGEANEKIVIQALKEIATKEVQYKIKQD